MDTFHESRLDYVTMYFNIPLIIRIILLIGRKCLMELMQVYQTNLKINYMTVYLLWLTSAPSSRAAWVL